MLNKKIGAIAGFIIMFCTFCFGLLSLSKGDWIFSLVMSSGVTGIFAAGAWLSSRKIKL
jgi:hypothetical protein